MTDEPFITQPELDELYAINERMKQRRIHKRLTELVDKVIDLAVAHSDLNQLLEAENKALKGEDDGEDSNG